MDDNTTSVINAIIRQHNSITPVRLKQILASSLKYSIMDSELHEIISTGIHSYSINKGLIEIKRTESNPEIINEMCRLVYLSPDGINVENLVDEINRGGRFTLEEIASVVSSACRTRQDLFLTDQETETIRFTTKGIFAVLENWSIELSQLLRNDGSSNITELFLSLTILRRYADAFLPGLEKKLSQPRNAGDYVELLEGIMRTYPDSRRVFKLLRNWVESIPPSIIQHFNRVRIDNDCCPDFIFSLFLCRFIGILSSRLSLKEKGSATAPLLNELMLKLVSPKRGEVLYDPTAGYGGTLVFASLIYPGIRVEGTEINPSNLRVSQLLAFGTGLPTSTVRKGDSLTESPRTIERPDVIVGDLPFGGKMFSQDPIDIGLSPKDVDSIFIYRSLALLKENGRAVYTVSNGFLSRERKANNDLRPWLIDQDWIEAIISLPVGLGGYPNLTTHILIVNKAKPSSRKNKVLMLNYDQPLGQRTVRDVLDEIEQTYHFAKSDKLQSRSSDMIFLSKGEIIYNQFNLQPHRYSNSKLLQIRRAWGTKKTVTLNEILSLHKFSGYQTSDSLPANCRYIKVSDLSPNEGDYILSHSSGELIELTRNVKGKLIDRQAILVSVVGNKIKPTWFQFIDDIPVIANNNILAIAYDENKIDPEYLIAQLNEPHFIMQCDLIVKGSAMPYFSATDFLNLRIELLPLNEQKRRVAEYQSKILTSLRNILKEQTKHFKQLEDETSAHAEKKLVELFSMLKHNLMQKLSTAHTDIKVVKQHLELQDASLLSNRIAEPLEGEDAERIETLEMVMRRMERSISFGMEMLESTGKNLDYKFLPEKYESVNVTEFLRNDILPLHSGQPKYQIEILGGSQHKVRMFRSAFRDALENLIRNAIRHGFVDNRTAPYNFCFIVTDIPGEKKLQLICKNDGLPFPELFSKERFFVIGEKAGKNAGTGLGGSFVKRVVDDMKGEIKILEPFDSLDPYRVQFEILLPIVGS